MGVVLAALLAVLGLKAVAIFNATRWLHLHGPAYRQAFGWESTGRAERERLVEEHGGAFFPFGLKDYRLRRYLRRSRRFSPLRILLLLWHALFFRLGWLMPLCAAALIATAVAPARLLLFPPPLTDAAGLTLSVLLLLVTLLIVVESVYGYALLGSYGFAFHLLNPRRLGPGRRLLRELQVFIGVVMTALLAGLGAFCFTSVRFDGFERLPGEVVTPLDVLNRILDSAYYTFMAFLGSGEADPRNIPGRLIVALLGLQGFAILVLVLGVLASAVPSPPLAGPPQPVEGPPPAAAGPPPPATGHPPPPAAGPPPARLSARGRTLAYATGAALLAGAAFRAARHLRRRRLPARRGSGTTRR
ncbi:hypothetical protein [Bailinhaonella thermotolerans]|uniref:Uncharacterized protein n=1 Tax=Bailinhaonella thermotolerans TaxID=1070861 RepID=A0A3A4BBX1_9ACTN|nr:hypothetical protein [Bailinhaonella thermotolerans]RJL35596.1 hypothetical protein D5H75_02050 [Bailinhaonella thermotolerans]